MEIVDHAIINHELLKVDPMVRIEDQEVLDIIRNDVLKREILDAPEAIEAFDRYSKILKKIEKKKVKDRAATVVSSDVEVVVAVAGSPDDGRSLG